MATFILTSFIYLIEQYRSNTVYYPDVFISVVLGWGLQVMMEMRNKRSGKKGNGMAEV